MAPWLVLERFATVLGLLGYGGLPSLVCSAVGLVQRRSLRRFLAYSSHEPVYSFVFPEWKATDPIEPVERWDMPDRGYLPAVSADELRGVPEVLSLVGRIVPARNLRLVPHSQLAADPDAFRQNMICLGNPVFNRAAARLIADSKHQLSFPVWSFDPVGRNMVEIQPGVTLRREQAIDGAIECWGILYRFPNPYSRDRQVLILAGDGAVATYAVARCLRMHWPLLARHRNTPFVAVVWCTERAHALETVSAPEVYPLLPALRGH